MGRRTGLGWEVGTARKNWKTGFRVVKLVSTILQDLNGHITVTVKTIINPQY